MTSIGEGSLWGNEESLRGITEKSREFPCVGGVSILVTKEKRG